MQAIKFTNWTTESFSHPFDGTLYTFGAGESVMMEEPKAKFFAKHLAEWSFNSKNIKYTPDKLEERISMALDSSVVIEEANESKLGSEVLKANTKKGVSEVNKPKDEKEALKNLLDSKGIKYDGRASVEKLRGLLQAEEKVESVESSEDEFEGLNE